MTESNRDRQVVTATRLQLMQEVREWEKTGKSVEQLLFRLQTKHIEVPDFMVVARRPPVTIGVKLVDQPRPMGARIDVEIDKHANGKATCSCGGSGEFVAAVGEEWTCPGCGFGFTVAGYDVVTGGGGDADRG